MPFCFSPFPILQDAHNILLITIINYYYHYYYHYGYYQYVYGFYYYCFYYHTCSVIIFALFSYLMT